jgi:type IV secretory pathway TrbD component
MDRKEQRKRRHSVARSRLETAGHIALALVFAYFAWKTIAGVFTDWPAHLDTVGIDGRLYYRAAVTFVSGGDPWTATTAQTFTNTWPPSGGQIAFDFTGPPPTVLAFVPFVWMPEWLFVPLWMYASIGAAIYTVRRLRLPWYWLLFPPLIQGVSVGNPQIVCLAVLLCASPWVRAIAAPLKAYAVIPMVGERQWRSLAIMSGMVAASVVAFWPLWHQYIVDYSAVQTWLLAVTHGGWSAARDPRLFALTAAALAALAVVDRRAAGWLAVPALWPAAQYFYATFAMPLRSPWLGLLMAIAFTSRGDALVPWGIVVYSAARIALRISSLLTQECDPVKHSIAVRSRVGDYLSIGGDIDASDAG